MAANKPDFEQGIKVLFVLAIGSAKVLLLLQVRLVGHSSAQGLEGPLFEIIEGPLCSSKPTLNPKLCIEGSPYLQF